MKLGRRGLLRGLLAAPAIIRTPGLLMAIAPPKRHPLADDDIIAWADAEPYKVTAWGIDQFGKLVCEQLQIKPPNMLEMRTAMREIYGIELSSDSSDRRWGVSYD